MRLTTGKAIIVKAKFLKTPFRATVSAAIEAEGVWLDSTDISDAMDQTILSTWPNSKISKEFKDFPKILVPFSQIEWIVGREME